MIGKDRPSSARRSQHEADTANLAPCHYTYEQAESRIALLSEPKIAGSCCHDLVDCD